MNETEIVTTISKKLFDDMVLALRKVVATVEDNADDDPQKAADQAWTAATNMLYELAEDGLIEKV